MRISPTGLAIVKAYEGCHKHIGGGRYKAYVDPVGVLTIGYGHTNHHPPKFDKNTVWDKAQCDEVLASDMERFERHVESLAKVPLAQHEFDALVSWSFNTGGQATATLWRLLNSGDKAAAAREFGKWNKGTIKKNVNGVVTKVRVVLPGLVRRRRSEEFLFLGNIEGALFVAGVKTVEPVPAPAPKKPKTGEIPLPPDIEITPPPSQAPFWLRILKFLFSKG